MQYYFIWNGTDSDQMGLWVSQFPDRKRGTERIEQVTVPGRAGRFNLSEGVNIYEPVTLTLRVQGKWGIDLEEVNDWLSGEGILVLGYEPDKCYKGRITEEVAFGRISNDLLEGQIQIECEPFKMQYPTEPKVTLTAAGTVVNRGGIPAYPVIKVTGSGNITLTCNSKTIALTGVDTSVTLDSGARIAVDQDGENFLANTAGVFPILQKGENSISWTGTVTSVEIQRNQRWK